ncbi:MAG TPA: bifunctional proline dehydrogenase/L-glutamate gamma-semialdehyde dehydrogenase PutA [Steroidobacteraceae bacterium]|nr:bifunctional proline dehydrogenase/L-glutamate gamma-semialdehyde dehydrogenase PutA [Steroidobacteraceae bacterium]
MSARSALGGEARPASLREAIRRAWRGHESECIAALLSEAGIDESQAELALQLTLALLGRMRTRGGAGRDDLLTQLALGSPAGRALLALAEALLRTPDADNADRLIRDQLARVRQDPRGLSAPLSVALRLAGAAIDARSTAAAARPWARLAAAPVRATLRAAMGLLGNRFIFAPSIEGALRRAQRTRTCAERYSFDMLGEAAFTAADAERYRLSYEHAIRAVGAAIVRGGDADRYAVSVKLSALHPRYVYSQRERVMGELLPRLRALAMLACRMQVPLTLDAEEAERLELSLDLLEALLQEPSLREWPGLGLAVQAYQKRAPALLDYLRELARARGSALRVRLVKGAYWDLEIKLTQLDGLEDFPVYTRRAHTDVAYLACAQRLLHSDGWLVPQFATHNARTVADLLCLAGDFDALARGAGAEFQRLHGMGEPLYRSLTQLRGRASPVRVYAPVGDAAALLPYLMRRLLENGASSSFVHRASHLSPAALAADPRRIATAGGGSPHPRIARPAELFAPERRNSAGRDLSDPQQWAALTAALAHSRLAPIDVRALTAIDPPPRATSQAASPAQSAAGRPIRNPADREELLGWVYEADEQQIELALQAAARYAPEWARGARAARAALLDCAADLFQRQDAALVARIVREAGRTVADAVAEVREAIDALRYYAAQVRAHFDDATRPLGPVVCISPWNFPLAIFTGQLAAALAAGNVVLAKPAEQTAATAALAVQLLHAAGVPRPALQLLPGTGEQVGMALVADARVRGVVFTGSTATARRIARVLARREPVPLIAETGGQNAMIVDSTALPEQVVADALRSAFNSAGQRCSSLRVLCLQREIAPAVLGMLEGAMRELCVGDPACLATDVGPLIDEAARTRIDAYLRRHGQRVRCRTPMAQRCTRGTFLAPALLRIDSLEELEGEVFGPVLHVLCFERGQLAALLRQLNALGYGLTLGIASRIESTIAAISDAARVGNVYVNRNMIGAVIGAQPFGGEGLSGTGPKAGGPLYLGAMLAHPPAALLQDFAPPPRLRALEALIGWLQQETALLADAERTGLLQRARQYAQHSPWGRRLSLPAAAGERNELRLRERGVLQASARSMPALIEQLSAALASGNRLWVEDETLATQLAARLPASLAPWVLAARARPHGQDQCRALLLDAAEAASEPQRVGRLRAELAAGDGPLVPVVTGGQGSGYDLVRLISEQAISTNTAALGGDAVLLDLADDAQASE